MIKNGLAHDEESAKENFLLILFLGFLLFASILLTTY